MAESMRADAGMGPEACANCGRAIGKLEAAHIWNEQVVCAECHGKLAGAPAAAGAPPAVPTSVAPPVVVYSSIVDAPRTSGLGIASLVLGLCALVFFCVPILPTALAVIGLVLGIAGWIAAATNRRTGIGMPIAGTIVCVAPLVLTALFLIGFLGVMGTAARNAARAQQQARIQAQKQAQAAPAVQNNLGAGQVAGTGSADNPTGGSFRLDPLLKVREVPQDGPLAAYGFRRFDRILKINGEDAVRLSNRDPQAAADLVRQACQLHQPIEVRRGATTVVLRDTAE